MILTLFFGRGTIVERDFYFLVWIMEFGVKSLIQAMSGETTRSMFLSIVARLDVFCIGQLSKKAAMKAFVAARSRCLLPINKMNGAVASRPTAAHSSQDSRVLPF